MTNSNPCVITGDFNYDLLSDTQFADELLAAYDLQQHINTATRTTKSLSTLLAHIYTHGLTNLFADVSELHIADHCSVNCTIQMHLLHQFNVQCHKYNKFRL